MIVAFPVLSNCYLLPGLMGEDRKSRKLTLLLSKKAFTTVFTSEELLFVKCQNPVPKLVDKVAEGEEGNPLQGHAQQQVDVCLLVRYVNVVVDQA